MPANAESHRATRQGPNSLNRLRDEVSRCCSLGLASIAFQACSFNHSDISPSLESTVASGLTVTIAHAGGVEVFSPIMFLFHGLECR
jgi:hypothetical protein